MAGGVGSRFWPVSKTNFPKQFIDFFGVGKTLIQSTYERFLSICPPENIFIVTNQIHVDLIKEQIPKLADSQIFSEPLLKNTAPCIAYGCLKISQINPNAKIIVAPSDHTITKPEVFIQTLKTALKATTTDCLITLGIKPSRPDTGYGYIQYEEESLAQHAQLKKVKVFTEKPSLELAETFIKSGDFLWNAGIFIWSASAILKAFELHLHDMYEIFQQIIPDLNTDNEANALDLAYHKCVNISIDFAILEKAQNVYVLPSDFGWSDLGTWESIYQLAEKDYVGNVVIPSEKVIMLDSNNCMVNTQPDKVVILKDLNNYIVVDTPQALMILPREEEQKVKEIVTEVKLKFGNSFI